MDCLVSNDHLSGTAVLKLAPEDEDEDTTIERKSHRNTGHECSVNIVEAAAGERARGYTRCSGKGSGSKGGLIDLPTCHHTEVKFRCGFWKWPKTPKKLSRMPTKISP